MPQDSDTARRDTDHQHQPLPILLPPWLKQRACQPDSLSISLQSLPLRPSTLTALIRSGFSTTGDVMNSCRTEMISAEDGNVERSGNANGESNGANDASINISDGKSTFGNFANELACSTSQAADYAHEINDALGYVGLPITVTASTQNDVDGENANQYGTDNDKNIMAPHPSIYPATAASILRSRGSNHFPGINGSHRHIVSFSQPLDMLLGGGFALSELTEIAGLPGVGKTQLAMQLCVDTRLPGKLGGVEGHAVVIDAEGSWSGAAGGDRLWSMATALVTHVTESASRRLQARRRREGAGAIVNENEPVLLGYNAESILEGIHIFRVHDEASQTCTLYNLPNLLLKLEEKGTPVKLVVIDSLAFHYRVASSSSYTNASNVRHKSNSLSTTHNLTRMAAFLTEMASEFDLAVVAMNHLTTRIEKDGSNNTGTKLVPALGESWAHSITSRLMIDHYRHFHNAGTSTSTIPHNMDEVRTCTLVKSPHKPNGTALFMITDKGIRGVPLPLLQSLAPKRTRLN
mmetsp:Transcript_1688/g.3700  ORF Transcript_1688/g.3700 Transcript_1688/m.3700 type:complete len:521 (+) Transcript_1688:65-1627(+)